MEAGCTLAEIRGSATLTAPTAEERTDEILGTALRRGVAFAAYALTVVRRPFALPTASAADQCSASGLATTASGAAGLRRHLSGRPPGCLITCSAGPFFAHPGEFLDLKGIAQPLTDLPQPMRCCCHTRHWRRSSNPSSREKYRYMRPSRSAHDCMSKGGPCTRMRRCRSPCRRPGDARQHRQLAGSRPAHFTVEDFK